ncbi:hypothetical protein HYN56_20600 [Flavobacterium crocinum]|uniref:Immunity protein 26 n=1 Tax=Flavobacterium crocinum TaxID=2183896 RepID=A0A2S1YR01_9FLAO|nr:immunity 26/phosphotriesterase HocA family protein [Flavobacterium crocinum]AWK06491.1 hypothetical protein HYN56_20600 [Flavobacterium crocinum]
MEKIVFELNNEQRKYLGLLPVESDWELVKLKDMYLYFDKEDIVRKKITVSENQYLEQELYEKTTDNRTILLPKTTKGKPKKLNFTATQSFSPFGVYLSFFSDYLSISNYTTQTSYFSTNLEDKTINGFKEWLNKWQKETTNDDLLDIENFKLSKRLNCKFKEGDFFSFKIGRRNWGFGRILMDVAKLRKNQDFEANKNYGLKNLMGRPLIVKVYHKISDTENIDLNELLSCDALPSQAIMDNHFFYGQNKIIGHKVLEYSDLDPLISYGKSINNNDRGTVYLQYGLIYKEVDVYKFDKYLISRGKTKNGLYETSLYRNEGIGFGLDIDELNECILEESNNPYWNGNDYMRKRDLRSPENFEFKKEIFSFFGLDANKSYEENLKL